MFTLGVWTALMVVGFALVYLPRMADDFYVSSSLQPLQSSDVAAAAEALLGFLLLTTGISWILQLHPALNRRRGLARQLTSMKRTRVDQTVEAAQACVAVQLLEVVRRELATVEMDLL